MKILPVLRKQSAFFTLSWCAGLSASVTMPLRPGVWGRSRPPETHPQPYLRPFFWVCRAIWPEPNFLFHGVRAQLFFSLIIKARLFFSKNFRARLFFSILYTPPPPPWISIVQCLIPPLYFVLCSRAVSRYTETTIYLPWMVIKLQNYENTNTRAIQHYNSNPIQCC